MISTSKILASIITYHPLLERLRQNIAAIYTQVDHILIIDNASTNIEDIRAYWGQDERITLVSNTKNQGIAYTLNQAAQFASSHHYDWLLTLDQDSICPDNLIKNYKRHLHLSNIGIISCRVIDERIGELPHLPVSDSHQIVTDCITSASLLRISAWQATEGFCNEMFIDAVDFDFCYTLRKAGYFVLRDNETFLQHQLGNSSRRHLLDKTYYLLNHSPTRNYYIIRNTLYVGIRHQHKAYFTKIALKRALVILCFEKQRWANLIAITQALFHFCIGRYGQRP